MRSLRPVAAAVLACAVGGCTSSSAGPPPLPPGPQVVAVSLREYAFDRPDAIPAGRVVFRFVNGGRIEHQPDLLPLSEELPPIDQQLRGEARAAVTPFAGVPPRPPGTSGTFAVNLVPGRRYALICFARDPDDDESHALQGMASEFRAGGVLPATTATPAPPTTG